MSVHNGGDLLVVQKESERPFFVDVYLDGVTTAYAAVVAARLNFKIYIQTIALSISTHAAGTVAVQDNTAVTPVVAARHTDAAAGLPFVGWNFGPHGIGLPIDKGLDVAVTAGIIGVVHIEGYQKLSRTVSAEASSLVK